MSEVKLPEPYSVAYNDEDRVEFGLWSKDQIDSYTSALLRSMSEWQPIETAPIDPWILGYGSGIIYVMTYGTKVNYWIDLGFRKVEPTHWMPLPDVPRDKS